MKTTTTLIGVSAVLVLAGCTSYLTVRPCAPPTGEALNVHTGLVYYLPKTLIDVKVTYSVYEQTTWQADVHGNAIKANKEGIVAPEKSQNVIDLDTPPEITLVTIPDMKLGFALDPTEMVRFGVGIKEGHFEVNEDGMLIGAGVCFQDKSLEVAQGVLKAGIAVAKLAAVAITTKTVQERKLVKQVVVRKTLDLSDLVVKTGNDYVYSFEADARRYLGQYAPPGVYVPKAELIITLPETYKANASATSKDVVAILNPKNKDCVHGIVSRIPAIARVRFAVEDLLVADSYRPFAQVGGFAFAPISSRRFTEYTTGVTVSPTRGSITQFTINVTSAASALAASSETMGEAIETTVRDFRTEQMKAEAARLNAEADQIKARKALEDAKKP
ncbi:MAG: hypothetical protein WC708_02185 [Lentisphaeria bacterium]